MNESNKNYPINRKIKSQEIVRSKLVDDRAGKV